MGPNNNGVPYANGLGNAPSGASDFYNQLGQYMHSNMLGGVFGGIGSGLAGMFAQNPASGAMPYEQDAMNQLPQYYQPWINAGKNALGTLGGQYSSLLNNPGGMINQIGSSYHQSPGYQFQLNQALKAANQASGAGGMAGSPMAQQQNMGVASGLANQDYYNYLSKAMGMYGQGLQGEQGLAGMGLGASTGLGTNIADIYNNMANMQYAGQQQQNQNQGAGFGGMLGGLGMLSGL